MSAWHIGDVTVQSGGKSNDRETGELLQSGVALFRYGPSPGAWNVDAKSDWEIHQWALAEAAGNDVKLETDYVPKDSDMPKRVRAYLKHCQVHPTRGQIS